MHKAIFIAFILFLAACSPNNSIKIEQDPLKVFPSRLVQNVLIESIMSEQNEESIQVTRQIEHYKELYGHRVVPVVFHENDFMETPNTELLGNLLGGYLFNPKAALNRATVKNTLFGEDNILWLSPQNWDWALQQRLADTAKVALAISSGIGKDGKGYVTTYMAHRGAIPSCKLAIYFVADSLLHQAQVGASPNYFHKFVFTDAFPSLYGSAVNLNQSNADGMIDSYTVDGIDLSQFNLSNLHIISLLYADDVDFRKRKVLNVQQARFGGIKYWDGN